MESDCSGTTLATGVRDPIPKSIATSRQNRSWHDPGALAWPNDHDYAEIGRLMYLSFYGLREPPFELTSDPQFLFYTGQHREALCNLKCGLMTAKAVTLLIGGAGTGKTTLLRAALRSEQCRDVTAIVIDNPALTRAEFVEMIATRFQLGSDAARSKTALLNALEPMLHERHKQGQRMALIVDEAQTLGNDLLEEIRLLANIETDKEKLLPVVLAGQPQLTARLNEPDLQQLKQRVALRCQIGPLTLEESAAYIVSRLRMAGGNTTQLFTRDAVTLIHKLSGGIPRTLNVLCENALINGYAMGKRPVDRETVLEVSRDFDLAPGNAHSSEEKPTPVYQDQNAPTESERTLFVDLPRRRGLRAMFGLG
jgi:general secretion pathway protein A